eukprot:gene6314-7389_t
MSSVAALKAQLDAELAAHVTSAVAARTVRDAPPRRASPPRPAAALAAAAAGGGKRGERNELGVELAQWRCDLCGVIATGADPLRMHIEGKRHQQMALRHPEQAEASEA